jgi:hypothetical protein
MERAFLEKGIMDVLHIRGKEEVTHHAEMHTCATSSPKTVRGRSLVPFQPLHLVLHEDQSLGKP